MRTSLALHESFKTISTEEEAHETTDPPWTPVAYIVLWLSVTVGFARGYDHTAALMSFQTSEYLEAPREVEKKGNEANE